MSAMSRCTSDDPPTVCSLPVGPRVNCSVTPEQWPNRNNFKTHAHCYRPTMDFQCTSLTTERGIRTEKVNSEREVLIYGENFCSGIFLRQSNWMTNPISKAMNYICCDSHVNGIQSTAK